MDPLKICLVSSEVAPFAKTGGLADVASALARFLGRAGHDVRVVMPLYRRIRAGDWDIEPLDGMQDISLELGDRELTFSVLSTRLPDSEVSVYLVDCPDLYDRDEIYTAGDDDAVRFALLSRACLEACQRMRFSVDVFHVNDYPATPARAEIDDSFRVYPGDGVAPLKQIFRDLHAGGFRGALSLELFNRDYWKQNALEVARTGLEKTREAVARSLEA